jgi:tetratricopeptide (TPR) repeat protein
MNHFKGFAFILNVIRFYLCILGALFVITMSTGGELFTFKHLWLYSLSSIPFCFLLAYCLERFGSALGNLFSGWSSRRVSPRETLSADLEKAKSCKRNGEFEEANQIIDQVLEKDPDFPDALYLKAQILWEGFEKKQEASECLLSVMKLVPQENTLHRWASSLLKELLDHQ